MGVVCRARPVTYFRCSLARPAREIYRNNQIEMGAKRMRREMKPDTGGATMEGTSFFIALQNSVQLIPPEASESRICGERYGYGAAASSGQEMARVSGAAIVVIREGAFKDLRANAERRHDREGASRQEGQHGIPRNQRASP